MINETSYTTRKTILIGQDSYYVALPVRITGDANAVVKAGEPIKGDLEARGTAFTVTTSDANAVNLHDVKLDANGLGNATAVLAGCIDLYKVDSSVATNLKTAAVDNIILVKGSAN